MIGSTLSRAREPLSRGPDPLDRARDPRWVQEFVSERLLGPDVTLKKLAPIFTRQKGSDGNLVTYRVELGAGRAELESFVTLRTGPAPRLASQAARFGEAKAEWTTPLRPFVLDQDAGVLALSFPLDRRLPDLRRLLKLRWTHDLLARGWVLPSGTARIRKRKSRLTVASYRPERRAVLRFDAVYGSARARTEETHTVFMRLHEDPRWPSASVTALEALRGQGVSVPRVLARLAPTLVVESACPGSPAQGLELLDEGRMLAAGRLLSLVHRTPAPDRLPRLTAAAVHARSMRCVAELTQADADLGARAAALADRLERIAPTWPGPPVLVHGDLHGGQFLLQDQGLSLIDWDRAALADPAYDLGTLRANLHYTFGLPGAVALDTCLSGYEECSRVPETQGLRWHEAHALLRLLNSPYRTFAAYWRAETARLLDLVEGVVPC